MYQSAGEGFSREGLGELLEQALKCFGVILGKGGEGFAVERDAGFFE